MFRKGTSDCGETCFKAADSVPDEYLIAAFTREVRNMMMIFAGQTMQAASSRRYLLLLEWPGIHDEDEWRGFYFDNKNLKKAYDELVSEWEAEKVKYPRDRTQIAIWEFCPEREWEQPDGRRASGQKIRPVRIEDLRCFKNKK